MRGYSDNKRNILGYLKQMIYQFKKVPTFLFILLLCNLKVTLIDNLNVEKINAVFNHLTVFEKKIMQYENSQKKFL